MLLSGARSSATSDVGRGHAAGAAVRNSEWDVSIHNLLPVRSRRGGRPRDGVRPAGGDGAAGRPRCRRHPAECRFRVFPWGIASWGPGSALLITHVVPSSCLAAEPPRCARSTVVPRATVGRTDAEKSSVGGSSARCRASRPPFRLCFGGQVEIKNRANGHRRDPPHPEPQARESRRFNPDGRFRSNRGDGACPGRRGAEAGFG